MLGAVGRLVRVQRGGEGKGEGTGGGQVLISYVGGEKEREVIVTERDELR